MKIINALQIKSGVKAERNKMGTLTQPIQFMSRADKDEDWVAWNIDWLEMLGIKQIRRNARKLLKNYKLANGIIDKTDYIVEEDNENAELIDVLTKEDESAFELKFFPIIPNVVNVLVNEFEKRTDHISYRAVDNLSYNELLEDKRSLIEQTLVSQAEFDIQNTINQMNLDFENQEDVEKSQQMMSMENIKSLPEIEGFFKKDYRSVPEEWAAHQHLVDQERFKMKEMEVVAFKDSLITDREFWHFKMNEDDYDVELWNPILTFYHKSPEAKYISQSNWVGRIDLLTVPDIIDKYGYMMTEEQLSSMEAIYPIKSAGYIIPGTQNDGSFYDATKSHEWNTQGPSLGMRQYTTYNDNFLHNSNDIIFQIFNESESLSDFDNYSLLRAVTVYWKSQRMIGHLTKIDNTGMVIQTIVDETYIITSKPEYDNSLTKDKRKENLVFGEHIDWVWINEVWGGVKIGPNRPSFYNNKDNSGFSPIYLGCKPLKFQFKGDFSLYGCKLPVEGCIFSERNTKSISMVDKMKPYQIGFNLVNNQIADILIDELGTVILLDQNALPKHSMGEDWGDNNLGKAYVAMKDFQMLPLDTSLTNTNGGLSFSHFQKLDLAQTERLLSRVQLAGYFKNQAFEAIGLSPQRMGATNAQETAEGVQQAINSSYSQTEHYFTQHSDNLMPRVHQMRTDLAQYYNSTNPSLRLQYLTSKDERVNFEINGVDLLLRDLNIFITTKVNQRKIMEEIRHLALSNNTSNASIYDLGNIIKATSMAEITGVMKSIEEKNDNIRKEEQQAAMQNQQMIIDSENNKLQLEYKFKAEQAVLDRQNNKEVAEIKAAGYTAQEDFNNDGESDYIKTLEFLEKKNMNQSNLELQKDKELNKQLLEQKKMDIKLRELEIKKEISDDNVKVALSNKNKYDKKK